MQLEHSFTVPVGIDEAWRILLDIERIGPCMPGAAIDSVDGDDFTGTVKVKLGPINLTYKGKATFLEKDETAHRAVIDARGKDARGNGTAAAKVTAVLTESGSATTTVRVDTDLDVTGKPAQFGRGVMVDVGNKLIGQFADSLAATITAGDGGAAADRPAASQPAAGQTATSPTTTSQTAPTQPAADAAGEPGDQPPTTAPAKKARPKPARAAAAATRPAEQDRPPLTPPLDAEAAPAAPAESAVPADESAVPAAESAVRADEPPTERTDSATTRPPNPVSAVNGHSARSSHQSRQEVEPINLLESAGPAVAKRIAPVAVALVVVLLGVRRRRSKRST